MCRSLIQFSCYGSDTFSLKNTNINFDIDVNISSKIAYLKINLMQEEAS
jgi:hypothetical protein